MTRRRLFSLVGVVFSVGAALAACDLATDGVAMDATDASADGTSPDGSAADAMDELGDATSGDGQGDAPDDGDAGADVVVDSGTLHCGTGFVSNCLDCSGSPSLCALTETCTGDCQLLCAGSPIVCNACNGSNAPALSQCVSTADASACIAAPNQRCTCISDAGECPGSTQVCQSGKCWSCGEDPPNSDNHTCKSGLPCDNHGGGGNPLRYTCHP